MDTMVGPTEWEVDPTFRHWEMQPGSNPLLMLDAVREEDRMEVLQQATGSERWAVMFWKGSNKESAVYLESIGAALCELDYKEAPSRYRKGWWKTGDKGLCKGKAWDVWCPAGTADVEWPEPGKTWILPWRSKQPWEREDLGVYIDGTPRGAISYPQGRVVWTDGSVRKVKGELASGAGWVDAEGVTGYRRVGGETTIMRAEMAAGAMAVLTTPQDVPLTVFTDSLALLWLIRRWTREDFGFWIDREQHGDILQDMLDGMRARTALTHFVWVKAHAGNIGNEAADQLAHKGCVDEEEPLWNRQAHAIKVRMPPSQSGAGEVLSWQG